MDKSLKKDDAQDVMKSVSTVNTRDGRIIQLKERNFVLQQYSLTQENGRTSVSEPEVEWYVEQIQRMLGEIDKLTLTSTLTNSVKEIISYNTNEIEIKLFTIIRKLREDANTR